MNKYDYGFKREDLGPGLITAGLSMLSNNDGRMSVPQLIGQGGLDALEGHMARKKYEAAMARQQEEDAMNQQKHDLAMRKGNAELEAAARRSQLEQAAASGDEDAIKALDPVGWWKNKQAQSAANLAFQRALLMEGMKNNKKIIGRPTYVPEKGGYANPDGTFTPVAFPKGESGQKTMPFDKAAKLAGIEASYDDMQDVLSAFFDDEGNFKNLAVLGSKIPGTDMAQNDKKARAAIEAWLRAMTGAAAPKHEVDNYMDMYVPKMVDTGETALAKMSGLEKRLLGTMRNMGIDISGLEGRSATRRIGEARKKAREKESAAEKYARLRKYDMGG